MATRLEPCYRHPNQETRVHCTRCDRPICPDCMTPAPVGHHCPTCVAEGRRSVRRPLRIRSPRSATTVLLGINVVMFVVEMVIGGATRGSVLVGMGAMVPVLVAKGEWWRLITSMFLHVGVAHLALNAIGLYVFGSVIENVYGTARFLAIYFVAGFCASAASFAFAPQGGVAAGASGAIFGLVGAWVAWNLRRRQLSLARANIQGALMLVALNLVLGFAIPGIDNTAHIGGLVAGVLAGLAAEGVGRRNIRTATRVAGLVALAGIGLVLAAWRTAQLAV